MGRIRYLGVILYDADRLAEAASPADPKQIYPGHLDIMLDPQDRTVLKAAEEQGLSAGTLRAVQQSPVDRLMRQWRLALPLHPEYRTLPMVWYIPPLSPLLAGKEPAGPEDTLSAMRIPVRYLANLLAAGDEAPVRGALKGLLALRAYMRSSRLGEAPDKGVLRETGLDEAQILEMYRLLAIAKYGDRFVVPTAPTPDAADMRAEQGGLGFD